MTQNARGVGCALCFASILAGQYRVPFLQTPYFASQSQFDTFQLMYDLNGQTVSVETSPEDSLCSIDVVCCPAFRRAAPAPKMRAVQRTAVCADAKIVGVFPLFQIVASAQPQNQFQIQFADTFQAATISLLQARRTHGGHTAGTPRCFESMTISLSCGPRPDDHPSL